MASTCGAVFRESSRINFASWSDMAQLGHQQLKQLNEAAIQRVLHQKNSLSSMEGAVSNQTNMSIKQHGSLNGAIGPQLNGPLPIQLLTSNHFMSRMIQYALQSMIGDLVDRSDEDDDEDDDESSNPQEVNEKERSMLYLLWCIVDHRVESSV